MENPIYYCDELEQALLPDKDESQKLLLETSKKGRAT
jgi:hypothetical protein